MPGMQRLLNNAREANAAAAASISSISSSSSSNSCSEDDLRGNLVSSMSNMNSSCTAAGPADATSPITAKVDSPGCADKTSSGNVDSPHSAESRLPAASLALMSAVCNVEPTAALTGPSSASPVLNETPPANSISPQSAAPDAPPSTQASPSEAERGGRPSAEGYEPPWYAITRAADDATGQAGAPQPWWKLDSWLTAPAEAQYQRSASFHTPLKYTTCTTLCRWFARWAFASCIMSGIHDSSRALSCCCLGHSPQGLPLSSPQTAPVVLFLPSWSPTKKRRGNHVTSVACLY